MNNLILSKLEDAHAERSGKIIYLPSAKRLKYFEDLRAKLERAIKYFPEIKEVKIGGLSKNVDWCIACCDIAGKIIRFKDMKHRNVTIFHELMHIVQGLSNEIPNGERACSIFAIARMPPGLVEGVIPYIDTSNRICHKKKFPELCRQVIQARKKGHQNYIVYLEKVMKGEKVLRRYSRKKGSNIPRNQTTLHKYVDEEISLDTLSQGQTTLLLFDKS